MAAGAFLAQACTHVFSKLREAALAGFVRHVRLIKEHPSKFLQATWNGIDIHSSAGPDIQSQRPTQAIVIPTSSPAPHIISNLQTLCEQCSGCLLRCAVGEPSRLLLQDGEPCTRVPSCSMAKHRCNSPCPSSFSRGTRK